MLVRRCIGKGPLGSQKIKYGENITIDLRIREFKVRVYGNRSELVPTYHVSVKGKAIPVTGHEGPQGCETLRLPHFLYNRLTDGGEVVSPMRLPPFTPPPPGKFLVLIFSVRG
jgi:hypothetical protein